MSVKKILLAGVIMFSLTQSQAQPPGGLPQITQDPFSDTIVTGAAVTFTVAATGVGLTYQWQKNNVNIRGATLVNYSINAAVQSDAGLYRAIVSNFRGSDTSRNAVLVVATPPIIVIHPRDTSVVAGQTAVFSITASGTDPLSYQWQKNGVNIAGAANSAVLTLSPVQAVDSGLYRVIVSNNWGSAISAHVSLTVFLPPAITVQPHDTTVRVGQTAVFSAVASGSGTLTYRWQKNGTTIPSAAARTSSYTINGVQLQDSGSYRLVVSSAYGNDTSASVILTCLPQSPSSPPVIITQPRDTAVTVGGGVSFYVVALSSSTITYQWLKDGVRIQGAQGPSYALKPVISSDAGKYRVIVTNQYGTDTSNIAVLSIGTAPSITQQPSPASVQEGGAVGFSAAAAGTAPLSYQWQKNGVVIAGATASTYRVTAAALADSGSYRVVVSNLFGSVTSIAASLTVTPKPVVGIKPVIMNNPSSQTVFAGDSVTFTVTATGTVPFTYQWRKNGATIANAQSAALTLSGVAFADSGAYSVIISNSAGSDTSDNALLRVLQRTSGQTKPIITQQPSSQTVHVGGVTLFTMAAAGTRPFSYQWRKNGAVLTGKNDSVLTIASVAFTDSGMYSVIVSNSLGADTSLNAILTVTPKPVAGDAPVIRTHPASRSAYAGDTATFAVAATGTAPLYYQWQKNGVNIANAQSATYSIFPLALSDSGIFRAIVTNAYGSATSNGALLIVSPKPIVGNRPVVTNNPSSQTVYLGHPVIFSAAASGTAPLYYQWQKNGVDIANAKTTTFAVDSVNLADSGIYRLIVFNSLGSDTSDNALLKVLQAPAGQTKPVILQQPASQTAVIGDTVTFVVVADGARPFSFQWQKNGVNLTGKNDSTLAIVSVALADSGNYRVLVSNDSGAEISRSAALIVTSKPVITGTRPVIQIHPASTSAVAGEAATFAVVAGGTAPLTYQWQKNGVAIPGANGSIFTIASVTLADSGAYRVTVANNLGSETSFEARLSVFEKPLIRSNPASQTVLAGSPVTFTVTASGSLPLSYQWQRNGTDLAGETAVSFTIAAASRSDSGAAFGVIVTNAWGTARSNTAALAVSASSILSKIPVITRQPSSMTVQSGDSVAFIASAVSSEQLTFQWQKNLANIPGATDAVMIIRMATAEDSGNYRVVVSSKYGSVASNTAALTVILPVIKGVKPAITRNPAAVSASLGDAVSFSVSANGTPPLRYQWQKKGAAIAGAIDSLYRIDSVHSDNWGAYRVIVSNYWGSDTSEPAVLTIKNGSGASPVAYWTHNPVRASDGSSFTIDIPDTGHAGAYIADMAGNMVYRLIEKNTAFNPGRYQLAWRGQNIRGSFAGAGVYVYIFTYTRNANGKTTVIRKPVFLVK